MNNLINSCLSLDPVARNIALSNASPCTSLTFGLKVWHTDIATINCWKYTSLRVTNTIILYRYIRCNWRWIAIGSGVSINFGYFRWFGHLGSKPLDLIRSRLRLESLSCRNRQNSRNHRSTHGSCLHSWCLVFIVNLPRN